MITKPKDECRPHAPPCNKAARISDWYHPRPKTVPVSTGRLARSMRLPWVFRRRRVRTRVVPPTFGVTRCSEKRRRRLSPSRRIARAVRVDASVRKAPSRGSSPSPVHGRRDPRRRSWRLGAPKPSPKSEGFGQAAGRGHKGRPACRRAGGSSGRSGWAPAPERRPCAAHRLRPSRKAKAAAAIMEAGSAEAEHEI